MPELSELRAKLGKNVPGSRGVVHSNGEFFKEKRYYQCIDGCVIRGCAGIVSQKIYNEHKKRKKLNCAKTGKEFVDPGRQKAKYTYTPLTPDEMAKVARNLEMEKQFIQKRLENEVGEPFDENDDPGYMDGPFQEGGDALCHSPPCSTDIGDQNGRETEIRRLICYDDPNRKCFQVEDEEMIQDLLKLQRDNPDLVKYFVALMREWKATGFAICHIDNHLDLMHQYLDQRLPDKRAWERTLRHLNPGYEKFYTCPKYHNDSTYKGSPCSECNDKMDKTIRFNSVFDAICMNLRRNEFREAILHGPNVDYSTEQSKSRCSSIWSAQWVNDFRNNNPDFFDTSKHIPLLFGLFVDGFRTSESSNTAGAAVLVCFNLPPDIRMKAENLKLILLTDGPKEPSAEAWQRYLKRIVDEFKELRYGFTVDMQRYCAALICTIQDGRAVKKTSCVAEAGDTYGCSKCTVSRQPLPGCQSHYYSSKGNLPADDPRRGDPSDADYVSYNNIRKHKGFIIVRHDLGKSAVQNAALMNGIQGRSVFCDLDYWDPAECHLVCFMHTMKNFGARLEALSQGLKESVTTRNVLFRKGYLGDSTLKPVTDRKGKSVLPKKRPRWVAQEPAKLVQLLDHTFPSSSTCIQPKRFFQKLHRDVAKQAEDETENPCQVKKQKEKGDKSKGESAPMKQCLLSYLFSTALYEGGVDTDLAVALDHLVSLLNKLCAPIIKMDCLDDLEVQIWQALCDLEARIPITELPLSFHNLGHFTNQVKMFGPLSETWAYGLESYLGHLKGKVRNQAAPEASIYERIMYDHVIDMLITNLDEDSSSYTPKFSDGVTLLEPCGEENITPDLERQIKDYVAKHWKSYANIKKKMDPESQTVWIHGNRLSMAEISEYPQDEQCILQGLSRKAFSYKSFTINRTRFSIKKDMVKDDRVVFHGKNVGILEKILEVKVCWMGTNVMVLQ